VNSCSTNTLFSDRHFAFFGVFVLECGAPLSFPSVTAILRDGLRPASGAESRTRESISSLVLDKVLDKVSSVIPWDGCDLGKDVTVIPKLIKTGFFSFFCTWVIEFFDTPIHYFSVVVVIIEFAAIQTGISSCEHEHETVNPPG
jgi:hypothetical protein